MSDMRTAVAVASTDGLDDDAPNIVTVRVQTGTEGFGHSKLAYKTDLPINGISMIPASDPIMGSYPDLQNERTLILCVWIGADPDSEVHLLVSNDRGDTWAEVWTDNSGGVLNPKLMSSPADVRNGVYLFFENGDGMLQYLVQTAYPPCEWGYPLAWNDANVPTDVLDLAGTYGTQVWDICLDGEAWVVALIDHDTGVGEGNLTIQYNTTVADPGTGSWVSYTDVNGTSFDVPPQFVMVDRTRGYDEFGGYPAGTALVVWGTGSPSGVIRYSLFDIDTVGATITPRIEAGYKLFASTDLWMDEQSEAYFSFDQSGTFYPADWNKITNKEVWNSRVTPSTSITYGNDAGTGEIGPYVQIDNHGPTVDDHDSSDNFASFWTRSTERHSVAFPPFDPNLDVEAYFNIQFTNPNYHNIWFVVDDPRHPETPIFKADYYVGNDTDPVDTHPHDNARGLAMWFCKAGLQKHAVSTPADAPKGTVIEEYRHPINNMFSGYDDTDDNERVWAFKLLYNHTDDTFELYWSPDNDGSYVAFVPYLGHSLGDREYVDVGTEDEYIASEDEVYWKQPRNGRWPWRFYVGCPEVKPAFEEQSTIKVGQLEVYWTDNPSAGVAVVAPYKGCILPRLNGSLDLYYIEGDVLYRQTNGYGWQDVWGLVSATSTQTALAGPDQGELTLLNTDNYQKGKIYDSLRGYNAMFWARSGSRFRADGVDSGDWGKWQRTFFGTADTGEPTDDDSGSKITMRLFSPLRDMSRSTETQGFTTLPPPEVKDPDTGEGTGEKDEKAQREWQILYMTDFDRPADPTLPVDEEGRLMRYDDYITRYAWETMLGNPADKLDIDRMGFQPATFTLNQGGNDTDLFDSLRGLWSQLGMWWWYDYAGGGILHVWSPDTLDRNGDPDITLKASLTFALPFSRPDTDWLRAGNVRVSASNLESRPNVVVARVAAWPDGASTLDESAEWANGLPSQFATALLYKAQTPYSLLAKEWNDAQPIQVPVHALPYLQPGMKVEVEVETSLPANLQERYASIAQKYVVLSVQTDGTPDALVSTLTLIPSKLYGAWNFGQAG
jgi:hypothetical protein